MWALLAYLDGVQRVKNDDLSDLAHGSTNKLNDLLIDFDPVARTRKINGPCIPRYHTSSTTCA